MKSKSKIYIGIIFSILLTACSKNKQPQENQIQATNTLHADNIVTLTQAQYLSAGIKVGKVVKRNLSGTLKVNGILDVPPQNMVSISAPFGGFVKSTALLQGMKVKKGDVIAVLENEAFITLQQDYLENKSRYEYLTLEYNRQKELSQEEISATKTFQQITAEYKGIKARLKGLEQKLAMIGINAASFSEEKITRNAVIYAPINGYVTAINVNIGKYVNPTDVMFEIADTEHLHAELTVFEKDVTHLKKGQKIHFFLPNEEEKERNASVFLIGRQISPDRTIRVHAHLDQEDKDLIPGMYISALIEMNENQVDALPDKAIIASEGKKYIFIQKDTDKKENITFEMVEVQTTGSENGYTGLILPKNLNLDLAQVVTEGAYSLISVKTNDDQGHSH